MVENLFKNAREEGIESIEVRILAHVEDSVLLLEKSLAEDSRGIYEPITINVGSGESVTQAIQRGVMEETGLEVELVDAYFGKTDINRGGKRCRIFDFVVTLEDPTEVDLGSHVASAWVNYKEAQSYPMTGDVRELVDLFGRWRESLTLPPY